MAIEKLLKYMMNSTDMNSTSNNTFNDTGVFLINCSLPNYSNPPKGLEFVLKNIMVPCVCIIGIIGNLLTLVILNKKGLKTTCSSTERSVQLGFVALAFSDISLCISLLPHGLFQTEPSQYHDRWDFQLLYRTYSSGVINAFIMTSTWLTVTMATSRYLAICHPFRCRHFISLTTTKILIPIVFISCFLFNIPKILQDFYLIESFPCDGDENKKVYWKRPKELGHSGKVEYLTYVWIYFCFGILIPLTTLAFCNIGLMRALHESTKLRRRCGVRGPQLESNHRITPILVIIVIMYIVLVTPSEIVLFLQDTEVILTSSYHVYVEFTNVMQCINFSFNFALYYIMNIHFRKALWEIVCFLCHKHKDTIGADASVRLPLKRQGTMTNTTFTDV